MALLLRERGAEAVEASLPGAWLSTVNLAEVIGKLVERGMPASDARAAVEALGVELVDFDAEQASATGALRKTTRDIGLSIGDRACLALAKSRAVPAITADRAWAGLPGHQVVLIRD